MVIFDAAARIVVVQKEIGATHQRFNASQLKPLLETAAAENHFIDSVVTPFESFLSKPSRLPIHMIKVVQKKNSAHVLRK